nr:Xaa-Pro peptidase family protein [Rhizobium smilacinae]
MNVLFGRSEFSARLENVREEMRRRRLDAMLVSAPENYFYVCGYQTKAVFTFQFLLIRTDAPPVLFTRQMETANAALALELGHIETYALYQDDEDPIAAACTFIESSIGEAQTIGIELASWTMPAERAAAIMNGCRKMTWLDASTMIDRVRMIKSSKELQVLQDAGVIGDAMSDRTCAAVAAGASENDLAKIAFAEMVGAGSEYPGSWPNIMVGRRTGLVHAAWDGEVIQEDDHVTMELTGVKARYHAPSVRTVFIGEPLARLRSAALAMTEAHTAAIAAIAPGRPMKVINEATQSVLSRYDLPCKLARRSGYSLGIGFPPSWGAQWQIGLNSLIEDPLEVGMAFHVVIVGHFDDNRSVGVGCTVAIFDDGVKRLTRGGIYEPIT